MKCLINKLLLFSGVDSYKVDFEGKTVVVTGDVSSFEVIQCVSKVRSVEILEPQE